MTGITQIYGDAFTTLNLNGFILDENNIELTTEEESETNSSSTSTDSPNRSRADSENNVCTERLTHLEFFEKEMEWRKNCQKIFGKELTEQLYISVGSYKILGNIYLIDVIIRQKVFKAFKKSGAKKLYLSEKLDSKYQTETPGIVVEQETNKFYLCSSYGRSEIKYRKNLTKRIEKSFISEQKTVNVICKHVLFQIVISIAKKIFLSKRIDKKEDFVRLQAYLDKKWRRVKTNPFNKIDENCGEYYSPFKNISIFKYTDPPLFKDFQIKDIENRFRERRK